MFWKALKDFTRTLSFRLSVWYGAIFLASAALVFTLIYFLLGAAIDRKDRDVIEARLREYLAVYKHGGIPALRDWTGRVNAARKQRMFFVRVIKSDGAIQLVVMPEDWFDEDLRHLDAALKVERGDWTRVPRNRETDLTLASMVLDDGTKFQVGRSSDSRETLLAKFRQVLGLVISPVLLIGFIGGALLTRRMTKPICDLVGAASSIINTGRMDVRVPERPSDDELQELVVLFNRMLEHNEKLFCALRDSLDNVAHDLRTPLSRLRVSLEETLRAQTNGEPNGVIDAIEETERMQTIIRTLMDVAQAESGLMPLNVRPAALDALIDDVVGLYEHLAQEKQIEIVTEIAQSTRVSLDAARMRQAFANLLDNAIKYTAPQGRVTISEQTHAPNVEVIFSDTGVGIAEKDLPRIWERLYRTDRSRSAPGLGLGLSLVKAIVEAHGGEVIVESTEGRGSIFTIVLPQQPRNPSHQIAPHNSADEGTFDQLRSSK